MFLTKDLRTKTNRDFLIDDLPKYFDLFLPLIGAEIYKASNDNKADRDNVKIVRFTGAR